MQVSVFLCVLGLGLISAGAGSAAPPKVEAGVMYLTGYAQVGPSGSSGRLTTVVRGQREDAIRAALSQLVRYPTTAICEETEDLFAITFSSKWTNHPSYMAIGEACPTPGVVIIGIPDRSLVVDKLGCALRKAILAALPSGRAEGSRQGLGGCS